MTQKGPLTLRTKRAPFRDLRWGFTTKPPSGSNLNRKRLQRTVQSSNFAEENTISHSDRMDLWSAQQQVVVFVKQRSGNMGSIGALFACCLLRKKSAVAVIFEPKNTWQKRKRNTWCCALLLIFDDFCGPFCSS